MGMDVYGIKPVSEVGEYFRNNVWWWRPLWNYCLDKYPEIAGKVEYGHSNDGDGLDAQDSYKLGLLLRQDIESGVVRKYDLDYKQYVANLPKETCKICKGTKMYFYEDIEGNDQERQCTNCDDDGKTKSFDACYPFSEENVKEFADFCIDSGGFRIC